MAAPLKISVIMAAYNAEKYIQEAIYSVINQSHKNWELIIVDDGSTDQTGEIVKRLTDNRIIYIRQDNAGVSIARNCGLRSEEHT
ncbi:MAG: glycosyltransferase family 2 protein, partial [Cyclobacteriaceae bacterium]